MSKTYQRNARDDVSAKEGVKDDAIQKEINSLFATGKTVLSMSDLMRLRQKYNNEKIVSEIYDAFADQYNKIKHEAKGFVNKILEKYGVGNPKYPYHKVMERALKYKKKAGLSDSAFQLFQRLYEQYLHGVSHDPVYPLTNIGKALGAVPVDTFGDGLAITDKEYKELEEILKYYEQSKLLYSQILLQTITYRDSAPEAISGIFNKDKYNAAVHVHPIIAALFFPKIRILEEQFCYANLAYIIKCKHEKKSITTRPNYELYYNIITNPEDIVCSIDSPMADLKNRVRLQIALWESILNLRNGQYYNDNSNNFLAVIDACRVSVYDSPELMYVKDEGAILRRLLAAMAFRSSLISTTTSFNSVTYNVHDRVVLQPRLRLIPMLTLKLAPTPYVQNVLQLTDALQQSHMVLENKVLVPKTYTLLDSRDILVFYINRRFHHVDITKIATPFAFTSLPLTYSQVEQLNDSLVDFDLVIPLYNKQFMLRSVVCVESISLGNTRIITGCTTSFIKPSDTLNGRGVDSCFTYDPIVPGLPYSVTTGGPLARVGPVTNIGYDSPVPGSNAETLYERASRRGTIFIYQQLPP